jgi:hypothetical protein
MASERRSRVQKILAVPSLTGTMWEFRGPRNIGVVGAQFRYQHQTFSHNPGETVPAAFPNITLWWEQSRPIRTESVGTGDGSTVSFSHTAAQLPIVPGSVAISVAGSPQTMYDNGQGILYGSQLTYQSPPGTDNGVTGTVNYATGAIVATYTVAPLNTAAITAAYQYWKLIPNSYALKKAVVAELVATGDGATVTFTHTLASHPLSPGSFNGTAAAIKFTDNSLGAITGTGIASGTINYTSGAISITFSVAPASGVLAYANYSSAPALQEGDIVRSSFIPANATLPPLPFTPPTASGNLWTPTDDNYVRLRGSGGPALVELLLDSDVSDFNELQDGFQPSGDYETDTGV